MRNNQCNAFGNWACGLTRPQKHALDRPACFHIRVVRALPPLSSPGHAVVLVDWQSLSLLRSPLCCPPAHPSAEGGLRIAGPGIRAQAAPLRAPLLVPDNVRCGFSYICGTPPHPIASPQIPPMSLGVAVLFVWCLYGAPRRSLCLSRGMSRVCLRMRAGAL